MDARTPSNMAPATAHLVIHSDDHGGPIDARVESRLQRLRAIHAKGSWSTKQESLNLQINDLRGEHVRSVDDAGALVEVCLPAGTYHVSAILGKVRRSYMLALEAGKSFDLYLRLAPDHP